MKVATGTHIGPYEIFGWLGAGGMSEVYRARDPRLGREVAIKLLPDTFASDAIRVHRFEQEARAAGQLNHPNILAVHDVGIHAGAPYIVSELLEGESLRGRLQRGALPPRKAIDYARQTAEGLAAAHDKGIVHRDVKPDNLFVTNEGRIKILDFGIAKLTGPDDDAALHVGPQTETRAGTVVGTAGYMSPEQVRGEAIDARSDIFSFGTVLYEMLTGRPSFTRGTAAETMAAILKEDPPDPLPPNVPPALERIVSRCLEKTREERFQSARDLAFGLELLPDTTDIAAPPALVTGRSWRWAASWQRVVAGALAFGLALILMRWVPSPDVPPPALQRLNAELGVDASLAFATLLDSTTLSPDGDVVAFVAQKQASVLPSGRFPGVDADPQLYVRRLDQLEARPLPGTDGALVPFFSPDGQWIGFFAGGKLKKVPVSGGAVVTLSDAPSGRGGAWSEDGTIVFSPNQTRGTRLLRVPASGGKAEALTSPADGEVIQLWPQVLPGGKAVLYTGATIAGVYNNANLVVQALPAGERRVVQSGAYHGRYLPTGVGSRGERAGGHLVYMHDGTLFAAPFDVNRLEVTGEPVPALEGVTSNAATGGAQFAVSTSGTLVYLPGQTFGAGTPLQWMNREGQTTPLRVSPANWSNLLFSPDGGRLAMEIRGRTSDIWVYQFARDTLTRLTSDPVGATRPVWTPDSRRIAFASAQADKVTPNVYWLRFPEIGDAQRLTESRNAQQPGSWHPSGRLLAFEETTAQSDVDIMILPLEGDDTSGWKPGKPTAFLNTRFREAEPMFSPDGRWLAYSSNESGHQEVYVRPFPGPGGKRQISSGGGNFPTWSRNKPELFYGVNGQVMVAAFTVEGATLQAEEPRLWSEGRYQARGSNRMFDLYTDGERMALAPAQESGDAKHDKVVFLFNFFDELRRIAPASIR